jgi:ABC-type sulfate transport system permease component
MLITLVIYEAAFLSEVVRAGIMALSHGQMDAARALGNSYLGAMWYIILPQALYNMMPSILSQFVSTIKETTLGYVINVPELTFAANQINNQLLTSLLRSSLSWHSCTTSSAGRCPMLRLFWSDGLRANALGHRAESYPSNYSPKHLRPSHDH